MKFGISTASFYPMLLEDSVDILGKNNIANIEIFFNTFSEIARPYLTELRKKIKYNDQTVIATHPFTSGFEPFMLFGNYERRIDDAIELHKYYFEAMNIIGSNIFVFHGDRNNSTLEPKRYYERFARLRDLGKQFDITVAQENVERCKSSSLEFLKNMISYLDNDVAFVFDNKQATRSGINFTDFINTLGSNIVHCHLSDSNEISDCIAIGKGKVDFCVMLDLLKKFNFYGCVVIELYGELLNNQQEIFTSYRNLKKYFNDNNPVF